MISVSFKHCSIDQSNENQSFPRFAHQSNRNQFSRALYRLHLYPRFPVVTLSPAFFFFFFQPVARFPALCSSIFYCLKSWACCDESVENWLSKDNGALRSGNTCTHLSHGLQIHRNFDNPVIIWDSFCWDGMMEWPCLRNMNKNNLKVGHKNVISHPLYFMKIFHFQSL